MSNVNFSNVLRAAAHKGEHAALVADSVRDAATAYALNGGAKNLLQSVIDACNTTDKGKARTPAAGTLPAIILTHMHAIMRDAEGAGARPVRGADIDARKVAADAFGATVRGAFVADVEKAAAARRAAADARKDAVTGEKVSGAVAVGGAPAASSEKVTDSSNVQGDALSALLSLSDADIAALATSNPEGVARIVAVWGMARAASGAVAAQAISSAKGSKGRRVKGLADLGAAMSEAKEAATV